MELHKSVQTEGMALHLNTAELLYQASLSLEGASSVTGHHWEERDVTSLTFLKNFSIAPFKHPTFLEGQFLKGFTLLQSCNLKALPTIIQSASLSIP